MIRVFTEIYFRTDYSTGFLQRHALFKKQINIDSLKVSCPLTLPLPLTFNI